MTFGSTKSTGGLTIILDCDFFNMCICRGLFDAPQQTKLRIWGWGVGTKILPPGGGGLPPGGYIISQPGGLGGFPKNRLKNDNFGGYLQKKFEKILIFVSRVNSN